MSLADWLNTNVNNTPAGATPGTLVPQPPHGIPSQCVNGASSWFLSVGGPELLGPTAISIFNNFRNAWFDVIPVSVPDFKVQAGDCCFWKANTSLGGGFSTGSAGHVDVVSTPNATGFQGADEDWNGDPILRLINHTLEGVAGVFRPKGYVMDTVTKQDVDNLLPELLPNEPITPESYNFVGQSFHDFIYYVVATQTFQNNKQTILQAGTPPTVLAKGTYLVE